MIAYSGKVLYVYDFVTDNNNRLAALEVLAQQIITIIWV